MNKWTILQHAWEVTKSWYNYEKFTFVDAFVDYLICFKEGIMVFFHKIDWFESNLEVTRHILHTLLDIHNFLNFCQSLGCLNLISIHYKGYK